MATNPFGDAEVVAGVNPFGDMEVVNGPSPLEEGLGKSPYEGFGGKLLQSLGTAPAAFRQGVAGSALLLQDAATNAQRTPNAAGINLDLAAPSQPTAESMLRMPLLNKVQQEAAAVKAGSPDTEGMNAVMRGVVNAPASVALSLGTLPAVMVTKNPLIPAVVFGMQQAGQSYSETEGKLPFVERAQHALEQGGLEGGFEAIPAGVLVKDLVKNSGMMATLKHFAIAELGTEEATTLTQNLSNWLHLNPEKPLSAFIAEQPEAMAETLGGVVGGLGAQAGIIKGTSKGLEVVGKRLDAKFAAQQEELRKAQEVVLSGGITDGISAQKPPESAPILPGDTNIPPAPSNGLNVILDPSTAIPDPDTNPHSDIPRTEPTPQQLANAARQEERIRTGAIDLPENPEGVASLGNMDEALSNGAFKPASEEEVRARIDELLTDDPSMADTDPNTGRSKAERIARDEFPNALPMSQRDIAWSTNPDEVLLTSRQAGPQAPGTVRLVGGNPEQFSPEYVQALGETFQAWVTKYLPPDAKVIVNLSGLTEGHAGAYQVLDNGTHVITPQEIVRAQDATDGGTLVRFNTFSQSQTYGAITHEFGHALLMSQFVQGMPREFQFLIDHLDQTRTGTYDEERLARMPEEHAAVVRDYQVRKQSVLNGTMTASELMRNWIGVWKVGNDLMKTKKDLKSLDTMAREALADVNKEGGQRWSTWKDGSAVKTSTLTHRTTALELVHALGRNTSLTEAESNAAAEAYYLSFNEYMAEQFSRYAYSEKIDEGTALGRYFARALDTLRRFFAEMQAEGFIKPTESFKAWVDGVVKSRALQQAEAPAPKKRKSRAKAKPKGAVEIVAEIVATNPKSNPLNEIAVDDDWAWMTRKRVKELGIPITPWTHVLRSELEFAITKGDVLKVGELIKGWEDSQPKFDVKGKGGNWFHVNVGVLGNPLYTGLLPTKPAGQDYSTPEWKAYEAGVPPLWAWSRKIVTTYLNRYAGTKEDPLKDIPLPTGKTWGETMDLAISVRPPETPNAETLWDLPASTYTVQLRDFLDHAADYMRANVPKEKWFQYDFMRLLTETAKDDLRVRIAAEKAVLADLKGFPVHKAYEDGSRWLAVPDTLDAKVMAIAKNLGEVGGWCTKKEEAALRYGSGKSRLFTLVDATGKAQAQMQVDTDTATGTLSIEQLKGRFNGAVDQEWLPHARDFVTAGKWTGVKELDNAGLLNTESDERIPSVLVDKVLTQVGGDSYYVPVDEVFAVLDPMLKELQPQVEAWARKEIAEGRDKVFLGLVLRDFAAGTYTPEKYRDIMSQLLGDMQKDSSGLHFDNTGPEGQADRNNSNAAMDALKRVGQSVKARHLVAESINFTSNLKYNILQVQQVAATNPNPGLRMFVQCMTSLGALKNKLLRPGAELAKVWEHLPERQALALESILRDEELSGQHMTELQLLSGVWTHVAGPVLRSFIKSHGGNPDTEEGAKIGQLVLDYKNSILQHIAVRESEAIQMLRERYARAPDVLLVKANEIRAAAGKWRQTPYTPRGRFGNFIIKVFAKNAEGKRELVHVEHFETAALQDAAHKKFLGQYPAADVKATKISPDAGLQMTLPREFLTVLRDTAEFSDSQLQTIGEAMLPITSDKLFRTFARDASKVSGAEPDMLRNYANWIEDSANATAKFVYGRKLTQAVAVVRQMKRDADKAGDVAASRDAQRLADMMTRAKGFVMHPLDEFHKTKNAISLMYLLWAPKTAIMNLTGLLQTWAAVTSEFGDAKGHKELLSTMKDLVTSNLSEDDKWMLGKAETEGFVDQGFGYFMSGLANSGNLARRMRKGVAGRAQRGFLEGGMLAFTAVEVVNRKMTLLSIFRLELERGLARRERMLNAGDEQARSELQVRQEAYDAAAKKTKLLQNDYAAGNRPAMFQGKQSLFMIFYSFAQYMLWIMTGGYERTTRLEARARGETPRSVMGGMTMRMWVMFALLGGYEGVPFGKTLEMFVQWLANKFWGGKNVEAEVELMLKDTFGISSHYVRSAVQKGLMHDLGGIDLSGSFSMGTPIPGTKWLGASYLNKESAIGGLALEAAGPFGGVLGGATDLGLGDATESKTLGSSLPGMAGTVARAYDAWKTGLTDKHGALVLRDANGKARKITPTELAAISLGFPLTEVSDKRAFENQLRQQFAYWSERRTGLIKDYAEAVDSKDRALVEDMRKALIEYSHEAPAGMAITGTDISSYMKGKIVTVRKLEAGVTSPSQFGMAQALREANQ